MIRSRIFEFYRLDFICAGLKSNVKKSLITVFPKYDFYSY